MLKFKDMHKNEVQEILNLLCKSLESDERAPLLEERNEQDPFAAHGSLVPANAVEG